MSRMTRSYCLAVLVCLAMATNAIGTIEGIEVNPATPMAYTPFTIEVSGYFPDGCWGAASGPIEIDGYNINIGVNGVDSWGLGIYCLMVIIPYNFTYDIGPLPPGTYTITLTEYHYSLRQPFPDEASITITVGFDGQIVTVPGDQPTIQAGLDAASSGDIVLVSAGTYTGEDNRELDFAGKSVILAAESGPQSTIIDCEVNGRGFFFDDGEEFGAVVYGFTITRGAAFAGCGINCTNSSPTIANCIMKNNGAFGAGPAMGRGGGLYCLNSSPMVFYCTFEGNLAGEAQGVGGGGGMYCENSSPTLLHCTFTGNLSVAFGLGSAMYLDNSHPTITNCTFVNNISETWSSAIEISFSSPVFRNCIIAYNSEGSAVGCGDTMSGLQLICCDIFGNEGGDWVGCIADTAIVISPYSEDPMFCDTAAGNYHIHNNSVCAPYNNSCGALIGAYGVGCGTTCCVGLTGNVDGDPYDFCDLGDLTALIDYLFISHQPPPCMEEANIDGSPEGMVDLGDLTALVGYMFLGQSSPTPCPMFGGM